MGENGNDATELEALKHFIHSEDSIDKAFKGQDSVNAMRLMVLLDPLFRDNVMRLDLPSYRIILAIAMSMQRCAKHSYKDGIAFYEILCGMMTSRKGKRIDKLIDAIAGERKWKEGEGGQRGIMEKLKNWAGG